MNKLALSRLILMVAYLGISVWIPIATIGMQYESLILDSLTLNLVVFLVAVLLKRSAVLATSWVWLGANFVVDQAILTGMSYLGMVCSVVLIYALADVSSFLEFLYPMRKRSRQTDDQQYERTWSLFSRHARSTALFAASGGTMAWIGLALISPLAIVSNPLLAVGLILSVVLALTLVLSLEWREKPELGVGLRH